MRSVQLNDCKNPQLLYQYLQEREREYVALQNAYADLKAKAGKITLTDDLLAAISNDLTARGKHPLVLDGLPGITGQPQFPSIPRFNALPDAQSTLYPVVVVTGDPDILYVLNTTTSTRLWIPFIAMPSVWSNPINISTGLYTNSSQYRATATQTAGVTAIASGGGGTAITFDTEVLDVGGLFTAGGSTFTVPTGGGGLWLMVGYVRWVATAGGNVRRSFWRLNGATSLGHGNDAAFQAVVAYETAAVTVAMVPDGSVLDFVCFQDSGGPINTVVGASTTAHVVRLM